MGNTSDRMDSNDDPSLTDEEIQAFLRELIATSPGFESFQDKGSASSGE
jgi:hypothetical protein